MIRAIFGSVPSIIVAIILFLINPIFGILWVIWMVIVGIYAVRKDLIMKFFGWLFGAKK